MSVVRRCTFPGCDPDIVAQRGNIILLPSGKDEPRRCWGDTMLMICLGVYP